MKKICSRSLLYNLTAFFAIGAIMMIVMVGCGGGGSSDATIAPAEPLVQEGIFVDSPVEGIRYITDTQDGFTDSTGRFHYVEGETITFQIGDVTMGSAVALGLMTPVHLVEGAADETHPVVTNMARFMQSLDADGNPDNGITITPEIRNEVTGRLIDFDLGLMDFENHPDVTALFDSLNAMGSFSHGEQHLISAEQAQQHLRDHMPPGANTDNMLRMGVFVDSPVEGLHYETDTRSGTTDSEGRFAYMEGENIAFSIGGVELGHALAQELMTPIHLVEGATDETHPMVTNMARFLQSLDGDGDTDNGITITPEIMEEMVGWQIDFSAGMMDFENHPDVTGLLDHLNEMELFADGSHMLVPVDEAREHMRDHMGGGLIGDGQHGPGDDFNGQGGMMSSENMSGMNR